MLRQKRQLFELLFMAADLLAVSAAWLISYVVRFKTGWVPVDKGVPAFSTYLSMCLFIWLIWAFVYKKMGLYRPMRGVRRAREVWVLLNANALGVLLLITLVYLFREKSVPFSRLVFLYFWFFATFFSLFHRFCLRSILREIRRRGYNLRFLVVVGGGKVAGDIAARVRMHRELGIQLLGCLTKEKTDSGPHGIPVLGTYEDLKNILSTYDIDQVVVALPLEDNAYLASIMDQIGDSLVDIKIVPDVYRFISLGGSIEEFEGLPVIGVREAPMNLFAKRVLDILLASLLIVIFSPIMLILALLIKLSSRGPILYKQERVSYDGSSFSIIKFRTMRTDAEVDGAKWATPGDDRVTKIGRFMRSTSLDELPQLFNVIIGDMSLIGPRPERPVFIKEFRTRVPRYMLRHKVPAGMTGWAQVNGWRGNTSIDKRIEHDLYYIENWSLFLDFKILLLTLFKGFKNTNAY